MRVETSSGLKAGGLSGLLAGAGITLMFTVTSWDPVASNFSEGVIRYGLRASAFQLEAYFYLFWLFVALIVFVPLGMLGGTIFVKTMNRAKRFSVYIRAAAFAFLLWVITLLTTHNIPLIYPTWIGGILILFLCDSLVFAYIFNRLTRPSHVMENRTGTPL